jgi:NDP-sugar pyrophosphorylase family protein
MVKALILAAGMGTRLAPLTDDRPKCLVKIAGEPILYHQLSMLDRAGIKDCIVAIGYKGEMIVDRFGPRFRSMNLHYVDNPHYAETNNIYSLNLLSPFVDDDCVLIEGDVLCEEGIIYDLIANKNGDVAVLDYVSGNPDGTVVAANYRRVTRMLLKEAQIKGMNYKHLLKTVNIYKFSQKTLMAHLFPELQKQIDNGSSNIFYESVLADLIESQVIQLAPQVVLGRWWIEVDNPQDLAKAQQDFAKQPVV